MYQDINELWRPFEEWVRMANGGSFETAASKLRALPYVVDVHKKGDVLVVLVDGEGDLPEMVDGIKIVVERTRGELRPDRESSVAEQPVRFWEAEYYEGMAQEEAGRPPLEFDRREGMKKEAILQELELGDKAQVVPGHQCRTRYKPFCGLTGTVVEVVKHPNGGKLGYWVRIDIDVPKLYEHFAQTYNAPKDVASREARSFLRVLTELGQIRIRENSIDIFIPYDSGSSYNMIERVSTARRVLSNKRVAIHPELTGAEIEIVDHPVFAGLRAIISDIVPPFVELLFVPPISQEEIARRIAADIQEEDPSMITEVVTDVLGNMQDLGALEMTADGRVQRIQMILRPGDYKIVEAQKKDKHTEVAFFDPNSTVNEGRKRLIDPKKFDQDSFRRWDRWGKLEAPEGISFVVGKLIKSVGPKKAGQAAVQAIRFDKRLWPEDKAAKWFNANKSYFYTEWTEKDWKRAAQTEPSDLAQTPLSDSELTAMGKIPGWLFSEPEPEPESKPRSGDTSTQNETRDTWENLATLLWDIEHGKAELPPQFKTVDELRRRVRELRPGSGTRNGLSNKKGVVSPSYQKTVQNPNVNKRTELTDQESAQNEPEETAGVVYKYKAVSTQDEQQLINPEGRPRAYRPSPKLGS